MWTQFQYYAGSPCCLAITLYSLLTICTLSEDQTQSSSPTPSHTCCDQIKCCATTHPIAMRKLHQELYISRASQQCMSHLEDSTTLQNRLQNLGIVCSTVFCTQDLSLHTASEMAVEEWNDRLEFPSCLDGVPIHLRTLPPHLFHFSLSITMFLCRIFVPLFQALVLYL